MDIQCDKLNSILEALDYECMKSTLGLHGIYEDENIYVNVDGYTDYGRDLIIYRKFGIFKIKVLSAERDMNRWYISYLKTGNWIKNIDKLVAEPTESY
jgi:hypothetical protein